MYLLKICAFIILIFSFIACTESEQEVDEAVILPATKGVQYADSTSKSLQQMLRVYYGLKDALVAADSAKGRESALLLSNLSDEFNVYSLEEKDSALFKAVKDLPGIIKKASLELSNTITLEEQRAIFETISDNLYELIIVLKPAGIETYHQYCPMAFNDKGAAWLSDTSHIQNPYFGKKMLTCGEVKEELRFQ
jgi:hypothetical protein